MLIVLTSEKPLQDEANKINQLFHNGLETLHLRKPSFDTEGYKGLLNSIEQSFHNRIMIHQHHELCAEFHLKGIHIQEQMRLNLGEKLGKYVNSYKNDGYTVSASFHTKKEIQFNSGTFDYVLLSPVFHSISKKGYEGKGFDVSDLNECIIGMGGINEKTAIKAYKLGFQGIGVLGGVWNTENYLESFLAIKNTLSVGSE